MNRLLSIDLNNVVYFKSAHVPIQDSGYIVVQGNNMDAVTSDGVSNGAGKSLTFSTIANCLYQAAPLATKKKAKGEMLSKGSTIAVEYVHDDGRHIRIEQNTSSYAIYEKESYDAKNVEFTDEDNLEVRTVPLAEKWIEDNFPISKTEFYSYCYIQAQINLEFQVGSPSNRLEFITKLFRLDAFDKLSSYFRKELQDINSEQSRFSVLEAEYQKNNEKRIALNWRTTDDKELLKIKAQVSELSLEVDRLIKEMQELSSESTAYSSIVPFIESRNKLLIEYSHKDAPEKTLKYMKSQKRLLQANVDYTSDKKSYDKALHRSKRKCVSLKKTLPKDDTQTLTSKLSVIEDNGRKLRESLDELYSSKDSILDRRSSIKDLSTRIEKLGIKNVDVGRDIESEMSLVSSTLQLADLCAEGYDTCPTCQQDVNIKKIEASVRKAKKRKVELDKYSEAIELTLELEELNKTRLPTVRSIGIAIKKKDAEIKNLESEYKRIKASIRTLEVYDSAVKEYNDIKLDAPEEPDAKPIESSIEDVDFHIRTCEELLDAENTVNRLAAKHNIKVTDKTIKYSRILSSKLKRLRAKYMKVSSRLKKLDSLYSEFKIRKMEHSMLEDSLEGLSKSLEQSKPILEKRSLYESLVKAYSSKGLKLNVASRSICVSLQNNMNRYAHLLFSENFKFSITLKNGIEVTVDRGNGVVSDVRLLSGAESKCFRLLFLVSILPLISSDRRLDTVILDEVDSNMDEVTRARYISDFLPMIRMVVDNVIIITPNDSHDYNGADVWVVRKKKGTSTLNINGESTYFRKGVRSTDSV